MMNIDIQNEIKRSNDVLTSLHKKLDEQEKIVDSYSLICMSFLNIMKI